MSGDGKQLSNPISTGSGGAHFEANIQAAFVTLMLSGGYAPCLPCWPIVEIKVQGMIAGYATDDLIVFVENTSSGERRKLLGQVKLSISITANDKVFGEVIQAAWTDFNNAEIFHQGKDVIALITGPISATDTQGVSWLLEQARHTKNAEEFLSHVERAKFSSQNARNKLVAFKAQLKIANKKVDVSDEQLFIFLKSFHLLGYDLSRKHSVNSSLLQSHISQFNKDIPDKIWCQILAEVQSFNKNAGSITTDTLSENLTEHFKEPVLLYMPKELVVDNPIDKEDSGAIINWNEHKHAQKLAFINLLGSWNEQVDEDKDIVSLVVGEEYAEWIFDIRELLQVDGCPVAYKNGHWSIKDRVAMWGQLGTRIFDEHLERFRKVAISVLKAKNPSFELIPEERYAAAVHGKILPHSAGLRKGLAESLALVGCRPDLLTKCSLNKAEETAIIALREILDEADWEIWGSLNDLLPLLAEASPNEFMDAVEKAVAAKPSPFDELFEQEDTGAFGRNYLTGLLWALESIAWDEIYLTRASVVLAELASHDPGGNWANRPINSLTDIFLPWLPHTTATVEKRQVALKAICAEQSDVGWKLLESLLPNQHQTSSGTHKPDWRKTIPEGWDKGVTNLEFWEQSRFCAETLVELSGLDTGKLTSLAHLFDKIPLPASKHLLDKLSSDECIGLPEEERMLIWSALSNLIVRHKKFAEAEWSLSESAIESIEQVIELISPKSPVLLHKRLFSERDAYLYVGGDSGEEILSKEREEAVRDVMGVGGMPALIDFMRTVQNPDLVGGALASLNIEEADGVLLPSSLDLNDSKQWTFIATYCWRKRYEGDWDWFDSIDKSGWTSAEKALLLCTLPFDSEAWQRAEQLLGQDEGEYWVNTPANSYQTDDAIDLAAKKLIEFGRPSAAVNCLARSLYRKEAIDADLACDALLALVKSSEQSGQMDSYYITEIIKSLQENPKVNLDKLFQVEWAYVPIFDRGSKVSPKTLENKLATEPDFFCSLIKLIYRAEEEVKDEEQSESRRTLATNAYRLLSKWKTVPGMHIDGSFDDEFFISWLDIVEKDVTESGHYDVALIQLGDLMVHAPEDPSGLWMNKAIASIMNDRNRGSLRNGFATGIRNSRGAHTVDPNAKPERELAEKYRQQGEEIENAGYHRLAGVMRNIADGYDREAERILSNGGYFG